MSPDLAVEIENHTGATWLGARAVDSGTASGDTTNDNFTAFTRVQRYLAEVAERCSSGYPTRRSSVASEMMGLESLLREVGL